MEALLDAPDGVAFYFIVIIFCAVAGLAGLVLKMAQNAQKQNRSALCPSH